MTKTELLKTTKPILFNTEMVKAILDGRKTMTRRVAKINNVECSGAQEHVFGRDDFGGHQYTGFICCFCGYGVSPPHDKYPVGSSFIRPRYNKGDILYVRETWCRGINIFLYKADFFKVDFKWKPSIHMPKEAARIFLKVTDVRIERLQDITAEDCIAEGVEIEALNEVGEDFAKGIFSDIWDSTLKKSDLDKYGWDANPWVWVYEFEVIKDGEL